MEFFYLSEDDHIEVNNKHKRNHCMNNEVTVDEIVVGIIIVKS